MEVCLDRNIYLNRYEELDAYIFYFYLRKDYNRVFEALKAHASFSENHKYEPLLIIIFFMITFKRFGRITPTNDNYVLDQ